MLVGETQLMPNSPDSQHAGVSPTFSLSAAQLDPEGTFIILLRDAFSDNGKGGTCR